MRLQIQETLQYECIEETKIESGIGTLYQAMDLNLRRTVAVKAIRLEGQTPFQRDAQQQKAMTEVTAMVRLSQEHIHIPTIFHTHYDRKAGVFYIIMEWIPGNTLTQYMDRDKCPERQFLGWMVDLCRILEKMERLKIYHKDIKPGNIMIDNSRTLFLIDFNISLANTNLQDGTLHYRAPEMTDAKLYPGRDKVDMFALGVMLYEYYTGVLPQRGRQYARNKLRGPTAWDKFVSPKDLNPDIPDDVCSIIRTCMTMDPRQRYARVSDLKRELEKAVRNFHGNRKNNKP